jgi:phage major head subunit gpT-like protein
MPTIPSPARISTSRAVIGALYLALQDDTGESWVPRVAPDIFDSDSELETYGWLNEVPGLRKWIGGRQAVGMSEEGFSIRNEKFEGTLEIPLDWLRRDKTRQILARIAEQAEAANSHWAELLSALIAAGESTACYDGQYFFDTAHPGPLGQDGAASGSQSNDIGVDVTTATAPTAVEMASAIITAIKQLMGLRTERGRYLNASARQFLVYTPLGLMESVAAALGAQVIADTVSRTNQLLTLGTLGGFRIDMAIDPRSAWTTKFAVFRGDQMAKSLLRQEEVGIQTKAQAEGSFVEFDKDAHLYGINCSRAVGYGRWQHACLVTLS